MSGDRSQSKIQSSSHKREKSIITLDSEPGTNFWLTPKSTRTPISTPRVISRGSLKTIPIRKRKFNKNKHDCRNIFPNKRSSNSSCGFYILSTYNMPKAELSILSSQQIQSGYSPSSCFSL